MSWILVIAGNHYEYDQWERTHPTGRYIYLSSLDKLNGVIIDSIILTGRWWENQVLRKNGGWDILKPYLAYRCDTGKSLGTEPEIIIECRL
jgi:hypothetical protein